MHKTTERAHTGSSHVEIEQCVATMHGPYHECYDTLPCTFVHHVPRCSQGIYEDTDGSLLSAAQLSTYLSYPAAFPAAANTTTAAPGSTAAVAPPPWAGSTFHSAINNTLFEPSECVYLRGAAAWPSSNTAAVCAPRVGPFRRLHVAVAPATIGSTEMVVVNAATNRSSVVPYVAVNEASYMVTLPTGGREFWIHWRAPTGIRVDATSYK